MVDPITVGLAVGSLALGGAKAARGGRKSKIGAINQRYRGEKVTGYLTDADYAQSERLRRRAGEYAGAYGAQAETGVRRRAAARGIESGPALERDIGRVRQEEGAIVEGAAQEAESRLYNRFGERERFEQDRLMRAWGLEAGEEQREQMRAFAQESQFWNSFNDFIPYIFELSGTPSAAISGPTQPLIDELGSDYYP